MRIGEVATQSGINVETIRFYEREGLLGAAIRRPNGYRVYGLNDLERLVFIRHCRAMDMPLPEIRRLLTIADRPDTDCDAINCAIDSHLARVRTKLRALRVLERDLTKLRKQCAAGHKARECGILHGLSRAAHSNALAMPRRKRQAMAGL